MRWPKKNQVRVAAIRLEPVISPQSVAPLSDRPGRVNPRDGISRIRCAMRKKKRLDKSLQAIPDRKPLDILVSCGS
jgi:hypothetical protein